MTKSTYFKKIIYICTMSSIFGYVNYLGPFPLLQTLLRSKYPPQLDHSIASNTERVEYCDMFTNESINWTPETLELVKEFKKIHPNLQYKNGQYPLANGNPLSMQVVMLDGLPAIKIGLFNIYYCLKKGELSIVLYVKCADGNITKEQHDNPRIKIEAGMNPLTKERIITKYSIYLCISAKNIIELNLLKNECNVISDTDCCKKMMCEEVILLEANSLHMRLSQKLEETKEYAISRITKQIVQIIVDMMFKPKEPNPHLEYVHKTNLFNIDGEYRFITYSYPSMEMKIYYYCLKMRYWPSFFELAYVQFKDTGFPVLIARDAKLDPYCIVGFRECSNFKQIIEELTKVAIEYFGKYPQIPQELKPKEIEGLLNSEYFRQTPQELEPISVYKRYKGSRLV